MPDPYDHDRLRHMISRMMRDYPGLERWVEIDDVLQNALIRLSRALGATKPKSARHFYNMAALQIRQELLDLWRRGNGKAADDEGGALDGHPSMGDEPESIEEWTTFHEKLDGHPSMGDEPESIEEWTTFHEKVNLLPDKEGEVFGLIWYEGLTQEEVAANLKISVRTVKRLWLSARIKLFPAS